jgi:hypothetical protein
MITADSIQARVPSQAERTRPSDERIDKAVAAKIVELTEAYSASIQELYGGDLTHIDISLGGEKRIKVFGADEKDLKINF